MVLLASTMTHEQIMERIEEAISEYRETMLLGKEEDIDLKKHHLALACSLFMMNVMTNGSMEGAVETIKKIKSNRETNEIFNLEKSKN